MHHMLTLNIGWLDITIVRLWDKKNILSSEALYYGMMTSRKQDIIFRSSFVVHPTQDEHPNNTQMYVILWLRHKKRGFEETNNRVYHLHSLSRIYFTISTWKRIQEFLCLLIPSSRVSGTINECMHDKWQVNNI